MNELLFEDAPVKSGDGLTPEFYLGTVSESDSSGIALTMDGESEPMTKRYRHILTGTSIPVGARVAVMKISGTYVVLGELSSPQS